MASLFCWLCPFRPLDLSQTSLPTPALVQQGPSAQYLCFIPTSPILLHLDLQRMQPPSCWGFLSRPALQSLGCEESLHHPPVSTLRQGQRGISHSWSPLRLLQVQVAGLTPGEDSRETMTHAWASCPAVAEAHGPEVLKHRFIFQRFWGVGVRIYPDSTG